MLSEEDNAEYFHFASTFFKTETKRQLMASFLIYANRNYTYLQMKKNLKDKHTSIEI